MFEWLDHGEGAVIHLRTHPKEWCGKEKFHLSYGNLIIEAGNATAIGRWIRRALFQVHLWTGIVLALYIVVLSATGAFGLSQ